MARAAAHASAPGSSEPPDRGPSALEGSGGSSAWAASATARSLASLAAGLLGAARGAAEAKGKRKLAAEQGQLAAQGRALLEEVRGAPRPRPGPSLGPATAAVAAPLPRPVALLPFSGSDPCPGPDKVATAAAPRLAATGAPAPPHPACAAAASCSSPARRRQPSVPALKDPASRLRELKLPPPHPDDNYELSDADSDEEAMLHREHERDGKMVPAWCDGFLEVLPEQSGIDPDSIFGPRVPACVLEDVFPEELWQRLGQEPPPKRRRRSSANWGRDGLGAEEVRRYKRCLGQMTAWDGTPAAMPPTATPFLPRVPPLHEPWSPGAAPAPAWRQAPRSPPPPSSSSDTGSAA